MMKADGVSSDVQDVVADKAGDVAHRMGDGLKGASDKARRK
jgi:hypothetical protein